MTERASADTGSQGSALPPGTRLGEYELRRVIGVGGFGIVYLAVDHGLERDVAIKEYMPSSIAARTAAQQVSVLSQSNAETFALGLRSFVNEARLLARFDHPSLIKVHRFWEERGTAYMVMPMLRGRTLRDVRLAMPDPPGEEWLLGVLAPLLGALEVLHREDVFHRDIAPDNILVGDDGVPILLDFGAARRVLSGRSQDLTAILKPSYAPIEQYGESPSLRQGAWTDLYALGATLHFLVTGSAPAPATVRVVHDETPKLAERACPGVSRRFLEVVDWMLAARPGDRPQSVAEVREALAGRRPAGRVPVDLDDRTLVMSGRAMPAVSDDDATVVLPARSPAPPPPPPPTGVREAAVAATPSVQASPAAGEPTASVAPSRRAGLWVGAVAALLAAGAAAFYLWGRSAPPPVLANSPAASGPADAVLAAPAASATAGTTATTLPATAQPARTQPAEVVAAPASQASVAPSLAAQQSASPVPTAGERPARIATATAPSTVPLLTKPPAATTGTARPAAPGGDTTVRGSGATDARPAVPSERRPAITTPTAPAPHAPVVTAPSSPRAVTSAPPPQPLVRRPVPARIDVSTCEKPGYPSAAARAEVTGTTKIRFVVDAEGKVAKADVDASAGTSREHRLLDRTALEALSKCRFKPGTDEHGKPIGGITVVEYVWRLE